MKGCMDWWKESWCYQNARYNNKKNCQKFVSHSSCHIYCSILPLDAINFVNVTTENTGGLLYICWTQSRLELCSVHLTNDCKLTHTAEFPLHVVQDIPAETGCCHRQDSVSSFLFGAAVERVCASFQGVPQKSALRCGFVYNCMVNACRTAVFVPIFIKYRTSSFVNGSLFKI